MGRRKLIIALGLLIALAAVGGTSPAGAVGTPVVVSGPGSFATTYTQPVIVVSPGDEVIYANLDAQRHDVLSIAVRDPEEPQPEWCEYVNTTPCPIVGSALIGLGATTPLLGLEDVVPGETYEFFCSLHSTMFGHLIVLPE